LSRNQAEKQLLPMARQQALGGREERHPGASTPGLITEVQDGLAQLAVSRPAGSSHEEEGAGKATVSTRLFKAIVYLDGQRCGSCQSPVKAGRYSTVQKGIIIGAACAVPEKDEQTLENDVRTEMSSSCSPCEDGSFLFAPSQSAEAQALDQRPNAK
jgi:hypothetical protein